MLGTTRSWGVRGAALLLLAALNAMVGPTLLGGPSPANAADPCGAGGNKIACENDKLGTDPDIWEIDGAGDPEIQGFATDISVNVGQRIDFKIDTEASSYTIDIYRMGYYRGLGARKITSVTPSARLPQRQPACITDVQTDLYDCGNWGVSASWNVPSTAVSGVYIAHIKRSTGDGSHITFIVRDDSSTSAILFQTADPTWQAYNTYGGAYFYGGGSHGRAYKVSYNRPVLTRGREHGRDFFMSAEYAMVRFMERNGYDVSYFSGVDTDRRGALLKNHKVFLSVGHDEYWSKAQRANIEAARDAGVNLQFLSGNDGYWKTRYQPSIDGSSTSYRTLTSYKETWSNDKVDPDPEWTGTWRDPRFAPQSRGAGVPENALIGTQYQVNFSDLAMTVSAAEGKYRLWRNTSIANLSSGMATLAPHTVGYESNEDVDNGFRPAGLVRLSTTTGSVPEYLTDFGNTVVPGTTRHNMTMYKAPSGALVFSAGTVQWSWGLDAVHDSAYAQEPADVRMQQAQVNLFADMGAQPTTLMSGLASASKSTDVTAPTVSISTPAAGATTPNGQNVTITGTASDVGGRVAGVEVSTDGGNSWSAATGTTSWTYTFRQKGLGSSQVRVRAMDDSANIGTAATRAFDAQCPCSIFGGETPKIAAANDPHAVELGVRFVPLTDGFVTGVRFFKGTGNTGTHVGSLWSSSGERLAQATFGTESATGWQTVTFQTPVAVAAGKSYVASYTAPNGNYALESWGFAARPRETAALMVDGGYGAPAGGVFANPGQFPDQSHQNANYYVDVTFTTTDSSALIALNQSPVPGSSSVPSSTKISAKFSKPLAAGTAGLTLKDANGATVAGTTAYDAATRTVTFTPDAPLAGFVKFTAKATGTDTSGNPVTTGDTWSFTTVKPPNPPGVCPCTLFDDSLTPTLLEDSDRDPVTLGVRFTPDVNGQVTGVRFYKGANNTGSHTGTLWAADGTVLATGTFSDESTSGWQTLTFATPVQVRKGTTYTASYRTTVGRYSATPNAFAAANLSRSPLLVTSAAGAYTYGTGFPSASSSTSYLVDVVFEKVAPAIAVTGQDPAPGAVQVARGTKVKVGFTAGIAPSGWTMTVTSNGSTLPGSAALDATGTQLLWTPASQLPADAAVDVSLTGVVSTDGAALAPQTWTFHTRSADSLTQQSLFGDEVPAVEAASDGAPVELGVAWTPSRNGTVTAIRFYKGTGNTGTHTGSLWSADGTRLAQATFVAETATGWQTAQLSTPIEVQAGTSYVVSYFAPAGHYAYTQDFFNGPWTAGDLTAPAANNGRYLYAAGGGFPSFSWGAANYFVDVVFEREAASIAVDSRTPVDGATDVPVAVKPSITLTAPLATGWTMTLSRGGDAVSGQAALSGGGSTVTFTPAAALATDTVYTATLSGATSTEGAPLPTQTWTFRTAAPNTASLLEGEVPASASINDPDAVELGMAFVPSQDGTVTGIRFYKGTGNTGTHTGSVWDASGNRLGQLTFANETATGWQSASFTTPVTVTAGQTYVVSYLAPNGRYSATPQYFAAPRTVGPLTAPANTNGRFRYGASGGFPNESWNATNYFVDVVFRASQ
ncbi:hypothetical protein F4692_000633 [Nocardioides cavernae]|uniref:DUF4082 domain-containing protein n=1 Tax=Nocardioides cavernae TaxID=1921566 RepID=A0A7Y9H1T1_9ACTN|nr:DUF4082 domain-containing protein [Nocardioides cavernae]NYE35529.1 hypothetical protein [Nocardioides cavernae]